MTGDAPLSRLAQDLRPAELNARSRAAARVVAEGELLRRGDSGPQLRLIARDGAVTVHKVIGEAAEGLHGEPLRAAVAEETEKALAATQDVLSTVSLDDVEKLLRTGEALERLVAETREQLALHALVGADGLVAKARADAAWDRIRGRIRERRSADLAHLDHDAVLKVLDEEAHPDHVRDTREFEAGQAAHREALAKGETDRLEGRVRTAKRAGDVLEGLARKDFPGLPTPQAVTRFLATPAGQAAYAAYLHAAKPTLASMPAPAGHGSRHRTGPIS